MKKLMAMAATLILLLSMSRSFAQTTVKHRVVVQLSSNDTMVWKATIRNLNNLKAGWGDNIQIELVAHGPGIGFLLAGKTTQQTAINALKAQGVIFSACANSLKENNIDRSQVIPEAHIVPIGIGEVILKQELGWSYIKAGF